MWQCCNSYSRVMITWGSWNCDILNLVICTIYPKKYAHGFVVLCFVVVMQSFIMNSHEVFIHIHKGCFAGTGAIVRLPQCQWSKPDGYGKISQCITTTKHSKAKTVCIFLGIYCKVALCHEIFFVLSPPQWLLCVTCRNWARELGCMWICMYGPEWSLVRKVTFSHESIVTQNTSQWLSRVACGNWLRNSLLCKHAWSQSYSHCFWARWCEQRW